MAGKTFYATTVAGAVFIAIGVASSIYSQVAVDVPLDNVLKAGQFDVITPDMNAGGAAAVALNGSSYSITITDPDGRQLVSQHGNTTFDYALTAEKAGQYRMFVNNTGLSSLSITGHAQTKSSPLGLTGALMLIVTGIIVIGLGLRFRRL